MPIDPELKERVLRLLVAEGPLRPAQVADRLGVDAPSVRQAMQVLVFQRKIVSIHPPDYIGEHQFRAKRK